MLWASSKAFAAKVPQQSMWMMNGCSTPSSTFPRATNTALTSQSIQLSHPTVLILLGNDLENREWKTLVEEAAVPGGLQLPGCVCTMRNCFILNCFANAFLHVAYGLQRQKATANTMLPLFSTISDGMPTANPQKGAFTVLPLLSAQC